MNKFFKETSKIFSDIYHIEYTDIKKIGQLECWKSHLSDFIKFYYLLNDEESKSTFLKLFRLYLGFSLSNSKIDSYSLYSKKHWGELEHEAMYGIQDVASNDYILDRIETYLLKGYEYKDICKAQKGDYVLDCGAYTGNTSKYFSELVAEKGKVFSFEAMPQTYTILKNNTSIYNNIYTYNFAICDHEKKLQFTQEATPGSRICDDTTKPSITVQGTSIDLFVKTHKLEKVDFIKMDIEGSEIQALDGCIETCKNFSPKLAICIYHKADDWITIPKKILELNNNYTFYLKHNSNILYETVLFAICSNNHKKNITIDKQDLNKVLNLWNKYNYILLFKRILMYIAYYGFTNTLKNTIKKLFFHIQKRLVYNLKGKSR